ncbi:MAG: hypothetical protein QXV69_03240 [Sulfolobaceae archaeon]
MLVQTLTAILSIIFGILLGVDPSKGSLFSYYISTRSPVLAVFNIINFTTISIIPALIVSTFLISYDGKLLLTLIMGIIIAIHSILKYFFGRLFHYSGSLKVELTNIVKWSSLNPLISMDYFLLIFYEIFWNYSIITVYFISLLTKSIMLLIYKKYSINAIKVICSVNYDRILSIYSLFSIILSIASFIWA